MEKGLFHQKQLSRAFGIRYAKVSTSNSASGSLWVHLAMHWVPNQRDCSIAIILKRSSLLLLSATFSLEMCRKANLLSFTLADSENWVLVNGWYSPPLFMVTNSPIIRKNPWVTVYQASKLSTVSLNATTIIITSCLIAPFPWNGFRFFPLGHRSVYQWFRNENSWNHKSNTMPYCSQARCTENQVLKTSVKERSKWCPKDSVEDWLCLTMFGSAIYLICHLLIFTPTGQA